MGYDSIFWLPVCAVLTALGLVLTYTYGRRRGYRAMLRGAAWSLIPIAAYLTGSIKMLWKIGDAIGNFASGFVFSPVKWAGIGVTALCVALFFATSGRERRKAARGKAESRAAARTDKKAAPSAATPPGVAAPAAGTAALPAVRQPEPAKNQAPAKGSRKGGAALDDDMKDIEEILRNRGL